MKSSLRRIAVLEIFFSLAACAIVFRAAYLQFNPPKKLENLADRQFKRKHVTLPRRGMITDREGQGLAISLKVRSLYIRPKQLRSTYPQKDSQRRVARALAHILGSDAKKLNQLIQSKKTFSWVKRHLSEREETLIRGLGLDDSQDGLGLAEESRRAYPNGQLAAHVIGSVNLDGEGLEGLEFTYNDVLAGEKKRIASLKDAKGRAIFQDDKGILAFKHGQSIELSIDRVIQYEAEKTLESYASSLGAKAASAIVVDVKTGEVLAMANVPTYNPNDPRKASWDTKRNRAVTDIFEPGSVIKPLVIALALERGMNPSTKIYCEKGAIKIGKHTITEAESHEKHEWLSLSEIIQHSSNVGMAKLALAIGPGPMGAWLKALGIGRKTGIDCPGESNGMSTNWDQFQASLQKQITLANVAFGHGVTTTAAQLLQLYMAIANDGVAKPLRLVQKVIGESGQLTHQFENRSELKLFSSNTASHLRDMLRAVVLEGGTGTKAALDEWSVAGKTGTAQKIDPKTKRYSHQKYISSFVGFAPAKAPRVAAIVVIDEPSKGKYYAGETAAPAFKEIMRAALIRLNIAPDLQVLGDLAESNKNAVKFIASHIDAEEKNHVQLTVEEQDGKLRLPPLEGLTAREALRLLAGYPVSIEILGSGILKKQTPPHQEWLEPNSKIKLEFMPHGRSQ
jgi:cell division protein FtsI (penicillin-binding protein 3)